MYNWLFGGLLHAELKIFTVGEWNTAIDWYINNSLSILQLMFEGKFYKLSKCRHQ